MKFLLMVSPTFCTLEKLVWVSLVPAAAGQSLGEVGGPEQRGLESSMISEHGFGNVWKVVGAGGIHLEFYGENL